MNTAAFTPGPWEANGNAIQTEDGEYVANLSSPRGMEQRERDARLIAAAPELYGAARFLLDIADALLIDKGAPADAAREQVRAALAKARGEQVVA